MLRLLAVGIGGFAGAIARYGLSGLIYRFYRGAFPAGTLVVNVLGCLVIGVLMSLVEERLELSPHVRMFLTIGLLGSFTTFSTVAFETFELLRHRELLAAVANVGANVSLGVLAVWLGRTLVRGS